MAYGFDHAVGFFVEVRPRGRKTLYYDRLQSNYNHERPLLGALMFLVSVNVISQDDLDGALAGDFEEADDAPGEVMAHEFIANLKRAASE